MNENENMIVNEMVNENENENENNTECSIFRFVAMIGWAMACFSESFE